MSEGRRVTAAVLLIGDELLSGRTRDSNLQTIAGFLAPLGVNVAEARVVRDEAAHIAAALNDLRAAHDYVFTTGGIGPTHDDITADSIAAAFGVPISERADALALLETWYARTGAPLTGARRRMARIPDGAELIANPVTGAPGFQIGNVFVLAGVPAIMRGMLEDVAHRIRGGAVTLARTVRAEGLREGDLAEALGALQARSPDVAFGSYPFFTELPGGGVKRGANLVARGTDAAALDAAVTALCDLVRRAGGTPVAEADGRG